MNDEQIIDAFYGMLKKAADKSSYIDSEWGVLDMVIEETEELPALLREFVEQVNDHS